MADGRLKRKSAICNLQSPIPGLSLLKIRTHGSTKVYRKILAPLFFMAGDHDPFIGILPPVVLVGYARRIHLFRQGNGHYVIFRLRISIKSTFQVLFCFWPLAFSISLPAFCIRSLFTTSLLSVSCAGYVFFRLCRS